MAFSDRLFEWAEPIRAARMEHPSVAELAGEAPLHRVKQDYRHLLGCARPFAVAGTRADAGATMTHPADVARPIPEHGMNLHPRGVGGVRVAPRASDGSTGDCGGARATGG